MVKLRKGNLIVLGLSSENIRRLEGGEPIKFNTKEALKMQEDYDIIIWAGPKGTTEADMAADIQKIASLSSVSTITSLNPKKKL